MADRDDILGFCDELLGAHEFADYGPNGLQVPGSREVRRLATGVSAHRELIERAAAAGADLLIAHHGLFWDFHPRALSEQMAARLRAAFAADLSIAGYHLPLDAHPELGNNALLCAGLGFERSAEPFGVVKGRAVGCVGRRADGISPGELEGRVAELTGREPLTFDHGPDRVTSIGIVSGAGSSEVHSAVALGLDAFMTGEPAEHAMADAREGRVHYLAAGHYATETFGVRRLGELIADRFDVDHEFIDIPNPI
jgi:dinuclear metal center YbgI/SA1388 family protein